MARLKLPAGDVRIAGEAAGVSTVMLASIVGWLRWKDSEVNGDM
jgi:hypothetical protein